MLNFVKNLDQFFNNMLLNEFFAQFATKPRFIYSIKWLSLDENHKTVQSGLRRDDSINITIRFFNNMLLNEFFAQFATKTHFIYSIKWLPLDENHKIVQSGLKRDKYINITI